MPNEKISTLTPLLNTEVADADLIPIVDVSGTPTTKSMTRTAFFQAIPAIGVGVTSPAVGIHAAGDVLAAGLFYEGQPAATTKAAAATLTAAELLTRIIVCSGTTYSLTMPIAADVIAALPATLPNLIAFPFYIINNASGVVTLATAASVTLTGTMTVPAGASGAFLLRKSASSITVFRIS